MDDIPDRPDPDLTLYDCSGYQFNDNPKVCPEGGCKPYLDGPPGMRSAWCGKDLDALRDGVTSYAALATLKDASGVNLAADKEAPPARAPNSCAGLETQTPARFFGNVVDCVCGDDVHCAYQAFGAASLYQDQHASMGVNAQDAQDRYDRLFQ